jgi:hypothetical protein
MNKNEHKAATKSPEEPKAIKEYSITIETIAYITEKRLVDALDKADAERQADAIVKERRNYGYDDVLDCHSICISTESAHFDVDIEEEVEDDN